MPHNRNEKRIRSDSIDEIEDGKKQEIDERYYTVVISYIKDLYINSLISSKVYTNIIENGTIDLIIKRKKEDGIKLINDTRHEERICRNYINMNYTITVSTWLDIFSNRIRDNHKMNGQNPPCHKICNYIAMHICNYI